MTNFNWTKCYDKQYEKPSENQQKYQMESYHHQQLLLLPLSLNNAFEIQTEKNIFIYPIIYRCLMVLPMLYNKDFDL